MGFWTVHGMIYNTLQFKRDVTQSSERNTFQSQCERASRNERAPLEVLNHGHRSHGRIVSEDMKAMAGAAQMLLPCDGKHSFTVYYYEWYEGKILSLQITAT